MSNWMPDVLLDPILFDGDAVVFRVKRLQVEDMNLITKNYDRTTGVLKFGGQEDMAVLAVSLVPKYVKSIDGLRRADGVQFTVAEFAAVAGEYYFASLVGSLLTQLMSVSILKADQEKNSVAPPPAQ